MRQLPGYTNQSDEKHSADLDHLIDILITLAKVARCAIRHSLLLLSYISPLYDHTTYPSHHLYLYRRRRHLSTGGAERLISEEPAAAVARLLAAINMPSDVVVPLRDLYFLRDDADPSVYVSDRRLVKAAVMLRVSAASNGRTSVSSLDRLLLQYVL
jgi:hypothetical protein